MKTERELLEKIANSLWWTNLWLFWIATWIIAGVLTLTQ